MLLRGSGADAHIFVGTENGIYRVPTADCARFTDCCSCIAARDPYCTYDLSSHVHACVAVGSADSDGENLLQDVALGNSTLCVAAAMSMEGTSTAPSANGNGCSTTTTMAVPMTTGGDAGQAITTLPSITGMWTVLISIRSFLLLTYSFSPFPPLSLSLSLSLSLPHSQAPLMLILVGSSRLVQLVRPTSTSGR